MLLSLWAHLLDITIVSGGGYPHICRLPSEYSVTGGVRPYVL